MPFSAVHFKVVLAWARARAAATSLCVSRVAVDHTPVNGVRVGIDMRASAGFAPRSTIGQGATAIG